MPKKPKCWSFSAGEKGSTVTVYERRPRGPLYARAFDSTLSGANGGYRRLSLGHRDRELAKTYALEQAAKLRDGRAEVTAGKVKLARLVAEYLTHRTRRKSQGEQQSDRRRAAMWLRILGASKDPQLISLGEWERFIDARQSGGVGPDGALVPEGKRHPVRVRTVEEDCLWLRQVLSWGIKWRDETGRYLLRENPVRGYPVPEEKNPRRPFASTDRYEAIRRVSDQVLMGRHHHRRSYLTELLGIAAGAGRRISAICALRYDDLRLDQGPHGSIRWPRDTDKTGHETVTPINTLVRAALDRVLAERPGIGRAFLFPSPGNPEQCASKDLASAWLERAERLAGMPKQDGSLWHAYRRAWVTARKHLPDTDVAAAGGWRDVGVLKTCYQRPDDAAILAVVEGGRELRERHG
jgi:integrase